MEQRKYSLVLGEGGQAFPLRRPDARKSIVAPCSELRPSVIPSKRRHVLAALVLRAKVVEDDGRCRRKVARRHARSAFRDLGTSEVV